MSQAFRNLALDLLDDEHGVNKQAWKTLADMLDDEGCSDIVEAIAAKGGRFRLASETADALRAVKAKEDDDDDEEDEEEDEDDEGVAAEEEDDEDE